MTGRRSEKMYTLVEWIENGKKHEAVLDNSQLFNLIMREDIEVTLIKDL